MSATLLQSVLDHFKRNLKGEDQRPLEHLQSQGITSHHALEAFEVGYATGGLTKLLSEDQFKDLVDLKLVDLNGRNRFKAAITFPLYDLNGELVDLLGQNMGAVGAIKALGDQARGFGHKKALTRESIYITDYPVIALKAYQEGLHNIVLCPCYEMLAKLPAKEVTVISYKKAEEFASHSKAEQVSWTHFNGKHKSIGEALANVKVIKSKPVPSSSGILDRVVHDLNELGYVGQADQKKLAFLVASSRKLKTPLSAIIVSSSGAGKSGLMNSVARLLPDDDKLMLSRLTPNALFHMPPNSLVEKLIVVDERAGSSPAEYSIRTLQSNQRLSVARPSKKGEEVVKTMDVRAAYMESTTNEADINDENKSRSLVIHLDESPESTEAILKAQREQRDGDDAAIIQWHHEFQKSLRPLPVKIPYVSLLRFPSTRVIYRREQPKLLSLIQASALVHQHERAIEDKHIVASVEDYRIALELYTNVFESLKHELTFNSRSLLLCMKDSSRFTLRDAITQTGWSYSKVNRAVKELVKYEYIVPSHEINGKRREYTIQSHTLYGDQASNLLPYQELSIGFS
jgi:hypothetical protein